MVWVVFFWWSSSGYPGYIYVDVCFLSFQFSPFSMCRPWILWGWGWGWMFMWGSSSRHPCHNSWVDCHHRVILFTNRQDVDIVFSLGYHDSLSSYLHVIIVLCCFVIVVVVFQFTSSKATRLDLYLCCCSGQLLFVPARIFLVNNYRLLRIRMTLLRVFIVLLFWFCTLSLVYKWLKSCSYGGGSSSKNYHPWPFLYWCCRHLRVSLLRIALLTVFVLPWFSGATYDYCKFAFLHLVV